MITMKRSQEVTTNAIKRMREDRWASRIERIQVRIQVQRVFLRMNIRVCIIPYMRKNEPEWRRDADQERRQRRCEAQINWRLRTRIRLEERIRILNTDFLQFVMEWGKRRDSTRRNTR